MFESGIASNSCYLNVCASSFPRPRSKNALGHMT